MILGMPQLKRHNPRVDQQSEKITLDQCDCLRAPLKRENATLGQRELCATSKTLEDLAQASSLKQILVEYKEYEELFQEAPTNEVLPQHQPQDHVIPIKEGKSLPFRPIYQLLEKELKVPKEYINENLAKGFIRLSTSLVGSLVLFVLKKDSSL